jgi:hypothetical protein
MSVYPHHEPRYAYGTIRTSGQPVSCEVLEVTHIPESNRNPVRKSVASAEFIAAFGKNGNVLDLHVGKLHRATYRYGRPNARARLIAGERAASARWSRGPCYWTDVVPYREEWFRWSVPLDFGKMPGVKSGQGGRREDYMRIAVADQISQQFPNMKFFVETVWNLRDKNRYWFDIYSPLENDLVLLSLLLQ